MFGGGSPMMRQSKIDTGRGQKPDMDWALLEFVFDFLGNRQTYLQVIAKDLLDRAAHHLARVSGDADLIVHHDGGTIFGQAWHAKKIASLLHFAQITVLWIVVGIINTVVVVVAAA